MVRGDYMQAVILAAGMGKRLKELTQNNTKCMVKVNGTTLIERMLRQIGMHDFSRIIIVVGYEGQKLIDHIESLDSAIPIEFITNPVLMIRRTISTLWHWRRNTSAKMTRFCLNRISYVPMMSSPPS